MSFSLATNKFLTNVRPHLNSARPPSTAQIVVFSQQALRAAESDGNRFATRHTTPQTSEDQLAKAYLFRRCRSGRNLETFWATTALLVAWQLYLLAECAMPDSDEQEELSELLKQIIKYHLDNPSRV